MPKIKQKQMKVIKISTKYGFSIGSKLTSKLELIKVCFLYFKRPKRPGGKFV